MIAETLQMIKKQYKDLDDLKKDITTYEKVQLEIYSWTQHIHIPKYRFDNGKWEWDECRGFAVLHVLCKIFTIDFSCITEAYLIKIVINYVKDMINYKENQPDILSLSDDDNGLSETLCFDANTEETVLNRLTVISIFNYSVNKLLLEELMAMIGVNFLNYKPHELALEFYEERAFSVIYDRLCKEAASVLEEFPKCFDRIVLLPNYQDSFSSFLVSDLNAAYKRNYKKDQTSAHSEFVFPDDINIDNLTTINKIKEIFECAYRNLSYISFSNKRIIEYIGSSKCDYKNFVELFIASAHIYEAPELDEICNLLQCHRDEINNIYSIYIIGRMSDEISRRCDRAHRKIRGKFYNLIA